VAARRNLVIAGAALAVLIICAAGTAAGIGYLLRPVDAAAGEEIIRVEIEPEATAGQISLILTEKGLIRSAFIFRIYARQHQLERNLVAGSYKLKPSMSLPVIAAKIAGGDADPETYWFTIPEGYTIEQIADRLAAASLVDREAFLKEAAQPSPQILEQFPFLQESAANSQVKYVLEGYLFPDTYEIAAGSSEKEIICLMLRRFAAIFNETLRQRCEELQLTQHEALTLASIIEGEARVEHERKLIAGVFYNRLERNYPLESCATVQYILGEVKEVLSNADTKLPSSYNTYQNPGLPPGPIGAPGEASILAALYPENTDYLFFVSKEDGTGEHYFSRTNSEHERYKELARKTKRKREAEKAANRLES